jgi:tagaturonate reductase
VHNKAYLITDDRAAQFHARWQHLSPEKLVDDVLRDPFWEADLTSLPGFAGAVSASLKDMMENGIAEALEAILSKRMITA